MFNALRYERQVGLELIHQHIDDKENYHGIDEHHYKLTSDHNTPKTLYIYIAPGWSQDVNDYLSDSNVLLRAAFISDATEQIIIHGVLDFDSNQVPHICVTLIDVGDAIYVWGLLRVPAHQQKLSLLAITFD